jgi:uncharacterized protein (TIGR00255 family)
MALKSMTGFGEGTAARGGIRVSVEISSVNRKQLDVGISLPRNLATLDARVQSRVRQEITRGRITGIIRVESTGNVAGRVSVDADLAAQYVKGLRAVAEKLKIPDDLGMGDLSRLPGLICVEQDDPDSEKVAAVLDEALNKALRGHARMRQAEGRALAADLRERLVRLEGLMREIRTFAAGVVKHHRSRLFQRLEQAGLEDLASDERVVKEIALFADRCDITEELTRLKSHLAQARRLLRSAEPAGRPLDFLCQEMLREINTIGSKANGVDITRAVVAFKTELERIREQVQNVE